MVTCIDITGQIPVIMLTLYSKVICNTLYNNAYTEKLDLIVCIFAPNHELCVGPSRGEGA